MTLYSKSPHANPEILQAFSEQVKEMVHGVELFLRNKNQVEETDVYEAYRLVHRCKGDADFLDLPEIAAAAERMVIPLRSAYVQHRNLYPPELQEVESGLEEIREIW